MDLALTELLEAPQYGVPAATKASLMASGLRSLTEHHRSNCRPYERMLEALGAPVAGEVSVEDQPYLPTSVFKRLELRSVPQDGVFKIMTSSGTTGQVPSRIYLDVETARLQTRALTTIVTHFIGTARLPMLIVDHPGVLRDRRRFSARAAGIIGMMSFGRDHHYLLDDESRVDVAALVAWLRAHTGQDLLVFGFTFMVWEELIRRFDEMGVDLSRATLITSGGWKKLLDVSVSRAAFKEAARASVGIERVHDFYGMVEQVGSVFFECPAGSFHAPNFADVVIRDPITWDVATRGEPGVIEAVSLLPRSYPGHALLTEDLGILRGDDDCPCGRSGRTFEVLGRVPKAEVRGCSDTLQRP